MNLNAYTKIDGKLCKWLVEANTIEAGIDLVKGLPEVKGSVLVTVQNNLQKTLTPYKILT